MGIHDDMDGDDAELDGVGGADTEQDRAHMAPQSQRTPVGIRDEGGLPVFDVPQDSPEITSEMVSTALNEV